MNGFQTGLAMRLTEADLKFLVETVATSHEDQDRIIELVRGKEDFLDQMLDNPLLLQRILNDEEVFVRISPHMLFSVLLHQIRRELEKETYINEVGLRGQRIPVFEAPDVVELLDEKEARDYLIDMLSSFARTRSTVTYWIERGRLRRRRFSDMDMDDMIQLCSQADPEVRPAYYKRIADIALFLAGIFPDQATYFAARPSRRYTRGRTLNDYEREGQTFYGLAARESREATLESAFRTLSEKFTLARRALNVLSERYMRSQKAQYFGLPTA
ncbi:MAG: hypothetical protein ACE5KI_07300 [Dehalococcoidia bacterium]